MFNGHLKSKFNYTHRRMKSTVQSFERSSIKKVHNKQQIGKQLLSKAKISYHIQQNFISSIDLLQEYLDIKPNDNQALYLCGISYLHLNSPIQSIKKLQRINYNFHAKQQSLLLLAMAYDKIQNSEKGLQIINQCLSTYNQFQQGFCYRGKLYLKYEQYQSAQKDFLYALKLNQNSFISRVGLGDCYYQQHKHEQALKYYQQSLQHLDNSKGSQTNISDIKLKIAISYFELYEYQKTINILQKLTYEQKQKNPQIYFYLGISYIKTPINKKKHEGILNLQYCIKLQNQQNKNIIQKSYKILIQTYLQDYQYYEAINVLKLTQLLKDELSCKYWKNLVQGCMLIIKSHYKDGLKKLNQISQILKGKKNILSIDIKNISPNKDQKYQNQFLQNQSNNKNLRVKSNKYFKQLKSPKKIQYQSSSTKNNKRKSFSLKHVKKISFYQETRNKTIFKTITQNKYNNPYNNPIKSYKYNYMKPQAKIKNFFNINNLKKNLTNKQKNQIKNQQINPIFTDQQQVFIMPIVLKFKAYAQFFLNMYLKALDTYQQYQNYMKNVFGKQSTDIEYNKILCQVFLLNQTQMQQQCLQKLDVSIQQYKKHFFSTPLQPILYKISILLQSSLPFFFNKIDNQSAVQQKNYVDVQKTQKGYQFLEYVLDINTKYVQQLKNHHLSHYFLSILYFLCEKYYQSQGQMQKTLKIVQQCSWKYLYFKGSIQIILQNYYDSIKQFTAGLILQQNADLYLARSIGFLLQGTRRQTLQSKHKKSKNKKQLKNNSIKIQFDNKKQQNNNKNNSKNLSQQDDNNNNGQAFIQNSFQDLQKFIQLQTDQQKISLWVTKLLFYNQAYQQSLRALQKVENKNTQLQQLQFWLKLYQGQFQQCGQIGQLIINSFQGQLFKQQQENNILVGKWQNNRINNILSTYDIPTSYVKWLVILHLFKKQKYSILIKYMQKLIFQSQIIEEEIQLRYNIGILQIIQGQKSKAIGFFQSMLYEENIQTNEKLTNKLKKLINLEFQNDQCIPDLSDQLGPNSNHRLSHYLPFKSVQIKISQNLSKKLFIKPSIPFPAFPKPNIQLKMSKKFFKKELELQSIQKRIQAPWIKRNKQKIQFTQQIIQAQTDFLKQTKQMTKIDEQYQSQK